MEAIIICRVRRRYKLTASFQKSGLWEASNLPEESYLLEEGDNSSLEGEMSRAGLSFGFRAGMNSDDLES